MLMHQIQWFLVNFGLPNKNPTRPPLNAPTLCTITFGCVNVLFVLLNLFANVIIPLIIFSKFFTLVLMSKPVILEDDDEYEDFPVQGLLNINSRTW